MKPVRDIYIYIYIYIFFFFEVGRNAGLVSFLFFLHYSVSYLFIYISPHFIYLFIYHIFIGV